VDRITKTIPVAIFGTVATAALLKWSALRKETDISKIPRGFTDLDDKGLRGCLRVPLRRPPVIDVLTFPDVVAYFADKRPGDPRIRAGALLSRSHPKGRLIFQVFLGEDDKLCSDASGRPYGRRLIARRLDDELAARFGTKELLIFR
jgi:hypothetical protein